MKDSTLKCQFSRHSTNSPCHTGNPVYAI